MTDKPKFDTPDGKPVDREFYCPHCGSALFQTADPEHDIRCTSGCIFLGGWVEVLSAMVRRSEQMILCGVKILRDIAALNRILAPHADDTKGVMDLAAKCDAKADEYEAVGDDCQLFGEKE